MELAVLGGKPIVPEDSFCDWPTSNETETKLFAEKLKSLSFRNYKLDPDIIEFEKKFNDYIGTKHCFTLNSGTAALYSALVSCDLEPTDNVIVPAYSFFSAATAVLNAGAKVKFCDVKLDTFNIDSQSLKEQIDEHTKVVMVVHVFGNPCDMDEINQIARDNRLIVIEDACQAHGAKYEEKRAGNLGDIAAFSFHLSKNLPIIEGGAVTTNNVELRDKAASANLFPNYIGNQHVNLGHNFKFNGLFAKIGLERIKSLDKFNKRRQENWDYLVQKLKRFDFIIPQKITAKALSANAMFVFRIDHHKLGVSGSAIESRNRFLLALHNERINCGVWIDKIVPEMEMFNLDPSDFPQAKRLVESTIYISGIHYPNSAKEMDLIVKAINKIADNREELKMIR